MEIVNRGVDALLISTRRTSVRGVSPAENKMTMRLHFCDDRQLGLVLATCYYVEALMATRHHPLHVMHHVFGAVKQ